MVTPVVPNTGLGVGFHSVGAFSAAICYTPQKYLKHWPWEIYWITQAAWCWLLWPVIGALCTIPHLGQVLTEAPKQYMLFSFGLGVLYGVGGTAFNISIHYIGFALTYAIAIGLSSVLGTLVPPLVKGKFAEILHKDGAGWVFLGIAVGVLGIALSGLAGRFKENDLRAATGSTGGFSLLKGLMLSLLAGVLSSVYNFSLEAAGPVADVAEQYGAGYWSGNVKYLFSNPGAFVTALAYSLYLARKNKTLRELTRISAETGRLPLIRNYLMAFLTGTMWYGQFFFYNLGHVRLGEKYAFSSWAIHMIMLVIFSTMVGIAFKEWKGCRGRTKMTVVIGLLVLCAAVLSLAYGNYLGESAGGH